MHDGLSDVPHRVIGRREQGWYVNNCQRWFLSGSIGSSDDDYGLNLLRLLWFGSF